VLYQTPLLIFSILIFSFWLSVGTCWNKLYSHISLTKV
jgi:hypothetical protein